MANTTASGGRLRRHHNNAGIPVAADTEELAVEDFDEAHPDAPGRWF